MSETATKVTPLDVLKFVRELLARPGVWMKGAWDLEDCGVRRHCLSGAFDRAAEEFYGHLLWRDKLRERRFGGKVTNDPVVAAYLAVDNVLGGEGVIPRNDAPETRLEHVLVWLDKAIELETEEAA